MKLFQITEDDLAELERIAPALSDSLMQHLAPRNRVQLRKVQAILSRVRWNYGPATDVEVIPVDPPD